MYTVYAIRVSFENTCRLGFYLDILIPLHLHIPRQLNQTTDQIDNMVLDWHISHQATHT
jgi:hypothetical protein